MCKAYASIGGRRAESDRARRIAFEHRDAAHRKSQQSPGSLFRGAIDEVEVIRRVLTPAVVKGLYAASTCGKCK